MMIELSVYKVAGAVFGPPAGVMSVVAVIDPSIQNIVVTLIGAIVTITTVVFAFKTAALAKIVKEQEVKVAEVIKVTDGMKTELVAATARASHAEGELKAKADQLVVAAAEARGAAASISLPIGKDASQAGSLSRIDTNTAETAQNTAHTDAAVEELKKEKP